MSAPISISTSVTTVPAVLLGTTLIAQTNTSSAPSTNNNNINNNGSASRKHTTARRPFTVDEDAHLIEIMNSTEFINWELVAQKMGDRSSRQCRERWVNYLSPGIRTDPWTEMEDRLLVQKINDLGRCWSTIGQYFNGRSENDVKNRWYSHLKYRCIERGGRIQIVSDPSMCPFPERKKRRRTKVCPQQNALKVLEQKQHENTDDFVEASEISSSASSLFEVNSQEDVVADEAMVESVPQLYVAETIQQPIQQAPIQQQQPVQQAPTPQQQQQQQQQQEDEFKPEIFDFWDSHLLEDYADCKFETEFIAAANSFPFATFN